MLDLNTAVDRQLLDRLETVAKERCCPVEHLISEALSRYLETEEHCEEMFRNYAEALRSLNGRQHIAA